MSDNVMKNESIEPVEAEYNNQTPYKLARSHARPARAQTYIYPSPAPHPTLNCPTIKPIGR
ncbi:hypothetical protein J1614_004754 [Plenodomus biglobosus]|nr:hypothetical protein J1614_004754 [Plenodomus biglobosus]